mmetsp:Transcript_35385/g.55578  ORF Transcript_35385/g.55578 Transcript_35385/m.55578 type:complete len:217 (+) Transcript_35385:402-1052(+)
MILLLECNTLLVLLYELLLLLLLLVLLQLEHPVLLLKLLPLLLLLLLLPLVIQFLDKLLIVLLTHQPLLLRGVIWLFEAQPPLHKLLLPLQWCGRPSGRHLRLLIMVGRLGHHQLCRRRPRTLVPGPLTLWLFLAGVLRLRHFFLVVADRRRPRPLVCALLIPSGTRLLTTITTTLTPLSKRGPCPQWTLLGSVAPHGCVLRQWCNARLPLSLLAR